MGVRHHVLVHWAEVWPLVPTDRCVFEAHRRLLPALLLMMEGSSKALEIALHSEQPRSTSLIHYSDRGSQYCSFTHIQRFRQAETAISMTQRGDSRENGVAERVNGILKTDFRLNRVFTTFDEAVCAVEQSVQNYNYLHPHMSCG